MEWLWIYTIFVLVNSAKTETFYISDGVSDSKQAQHLCDLAVPELYYMSPLRVILNLSEIQGILTDGTSLWIGYMRTFVALQYRGCVLTSQIQSRYNGTTDKSLGLCYTFCKRGFIGIENNNCYCLSSIPSGFVKENCDDECTSPSGTSCGKYKSGGSYVAIYGKVPYSHSTFDKDKRCRAYNKKNAEFAWSICSKKYETVCSKDYNSTDSSHYIQPKKTDDWLKNNNECLKSNSYPVTEQGIVFATLSEESKYWTGSIVTYIFIHVNDTDHPKEGQKQGYVRYDVSTNEFKLKFDQQDDEKKALCKIGIATDSSTSSHAQVTTTSTFESSVTSGYSNFSGRTTNTRVTTTSTKHSSRAPDSSNTTFSQEYRKDSATKEKETNLAGVYVAVPFTLILIAAIVGFIIWRKRRHQQVDKSQYKGAIINERKHVSGIRNATSNAAYQDEFPIGVNQEPDDHNYHILEPANEYSSIDDTVQTADENEYDTTNIGVVNSNVVTDNIYNRLDDEAADTYNHTNIASSRNEDAYNHTEVNNAIDTPSEFSSIARLKDCSSNDTYSHLEGTAINDNASLTNPKSIPADIVEDHYDHTGGTIPETKQSSLNPNFNSSLTNKDSSSGNLKPRYDYAFVPGQPSGTSNSSAFTLSTMPTTGDYEFAQEPTAPGYELAKPSHIYLKLSNDD